MRFHAYIRERSSLISRSKDAEAVSQQHSIALLLIAASERARSCSPGIAVCRTSCRLHQAQLLLHAGSQALSVTQSCTVLVGYTGSRLLIRPGLTSFPSALRAGFVRLCLHSPVPSACIHIDKVLNYPSTRQHAASWTRPGVPDLVGQETNREQFPSTIVSIGAPPVDDAT